MPATNELLQEGRYRIGERTSGSGNVFEAYDTVRNTKVIVREIPVRLNKVTTVSQQESLKLAFANQAKALTEIDHASLLHVQDYFAEIDRQYLVMESVEGSDLRQLLNTNRRPFSVAEVTAWADELLDALNHLHTHKPSIVHKNIRPENLRLDPSGKVKLLGAGLGNGDGDVSVVDSDTTALRYSPMEQIWPGLDVASQKVITNHYDDRSERILKEPLDARSDIYSLGATLYFLITGEEPVDPLERSIDILEGKLDPLREPSKVLHGIPAEVSDVLMKALEIKRENRYDSAQIMREVLRAALERVRERAEQQHAAAEAVRQPAAPTLLEDEARKAEAAEKAMLEKKAEEQRLEAEWQAAEAERVRKEAEHAERLRQEAAEAEAAAAEETASKASFPENLLEIPVSAEVVAYRDVADVDEAELAAVLEELEKAEAAAERTEAESDGDVALLDPEEELTVSPDAKLQDDVQVIESPFHLAPAPAATGFTSVDDDEIFSTPEKAGFSLPMPAIAGAIGLVVMLAVGGWFVMSGSSEPPKTAPAPVQVSEPAVAQPEPATTEPIVSTSGESQTGAPAPTEAAAGESLNATKTNPAAAKPKKAEAPKPQAEKKKAVTVDDLINDN